MASTLFWMTDADSQHHLSARAHLAKRQHGMVRQKRVRKWCASQAYDTVERGHSRQQRKLPIPSDVLGSPQGLWTTSTLLKLQLRPFWNKCQSNTIQAKEDQVLAALHHAAFHIWPLTVPAPTGSRFSNPIGQAWLQFAFEKPVIMSAFLFASVMQIQLKTNGPTANYLALELQCLALNLLQEELRTMNNRPSDTVILAVITLAAHGSFSDLEDMVDTSQSPLYTQQNMHIYGRINPVDEHVRALRRLIECRGGLQAIETYGIADVVALSDLYNATLNLSKPFFQTPWHRWTSTTDEDSCFVRRTDAHVIRQALQITRLLGTTSHARSLAHGLESLVILTRALEEHATGHPKAPTLYSVTMARNVVQHELLSCDDTCEDLCAPTNRIHSAFRLACLTYSDLVMFPLPHNQDFKRRRTEALEIACAAIDLSEVHPTTTHVIFWIFAMNAMSQNGHENQRRCLLQLRGISIHLGIGSLTAATDTCRKCVWWEPICYPLLKQAWSSMCHDSSDHDV